MTSFKDLGLAPSILALLEAKGFDTPTEIQAAAIPQLLASKRIDFHGQAQTGTGKTLAFGLPLLQKINLEVPAVQGLIVAPTRELVVQIAQSIDQYTAAFPGLRIMTIYGGVSMEEQMKQLRRGVHIVIGTPGRLNDHLRRKTLALKNLTTLVLDEADIMLDMGFRQDIDEILSFCSTDRSIWLFSATVKDGMRDLMKTHMPAPVSVRISQKNIGSHNTKQYFCMVQRKDRVAAMCRFIDSVQGFYGFIFCPTKLLTAEIAEQLLKRGYDAVALHGDMSQVQRNKVIQRFKDHEIGILVATDVAARGIDVADISHVINFSLPDDQENYVHRIGRTGRAGKEGIAITFVGKNELRVIKQLQTKFKVAIEAVEVPTVEIIAKARAEQAKVYLQTIIAADASVQKPYLKSLAEKVQGFTHEQLSLAMVSFLEDKFFKYLTNDTINFATSSSSVDLTKVSDAVNELYINVGMDDGLTKEDIENFVQKFADVKPQQCEKIKLIKRRTYIVSDDESVRAMMSKLRGQQLAGRKVMTFVSDDYQPQGQSRGRRREGNGGGRDSGRGFGGGRSSGGFNGSRGGDASRGGEGGYGGGRDSRRSSSKSWGRKSA